MHKSVLSASLFIHLAVLGQPITTNPPSLDFGMVLTPVGDTQTIALINNTFDDIRIDDLDIPNSAFEVLGDTSFVIYATDEYDVEIIFKPRHNIEYNTELVIKPWRPEGQVSVDVRGEGQYVESYYSTTQNLSEEALKLALKAKISVHATLGYNAARDAMYMFIDNEKVNGQGAAMNTLECVYTGDEAVGYTSRSDCQTNYGFTAEHTFPQSTFSSAEPMQSDLFHLFPAKGYANTERSNKPFGVVSNPTWSVGGSKSNSSTFEPRGQQKGPTSRAMLYFLTCYGNSSTFVNAAQQQTLKTWHSTFLPSSVEKQRNTDIFSYQQNRNPFIDHPEFAERITSFISTSVAPVVKQLYISSDTMDLGFVGIGDTQTYDLVLVATANTKVTLSAGSVSGSGLTLDNLPANVQPGEDGIVTVSYVASSTDPFLGELVFTTDRVANDTVRIPVIANVNPVAVDARVNSVLQVFPNPTRNNVVINVTTKVRCQWVDQIGRVSDWFELSPGDNELIAPQAPGVYLLNLHDVRGRHSIRVVRIPG